MSAAEIGKTGNGVYIANFEAAKGYKGSLTQILKLFEDKGITELRVGKYIIRKGIGDGEQALEVYDAATGQKVNKSVQEVLLEVFGDDTKASSPHSILVVLNGLDLSGKSVDLKLFYTSVKVEGQPVRTAVTQEAVDAQNKKQKDIKAAIALLNAAVDAQKPNNETISKAIAGLEALVGTDPEDQPYEARTALESAKKKASASRQTEETKRARAAAESKRKERQGLFVNEGLAAAGFEQLAQIARGNGVTLKGRTYSAQEVQAYLRDETVRREIGRAALGYIESSPGLPQADINLLIPYIRVKPNQRLLAFKFNGDTYHVLAEKKDGKWAIRSKTGGVDYGKPLYVEEEGGKFYVRQEVSWASDPKLEATVVRTGSKLAKPEAPAGNYAALGGKDRDQDGDIDFQDIDANGDGNISRAEAATVGIGGALFQAMDNRMSRLGVNGDGYLVADEMRKFFEVAAWFARTTGVSLNKAVQLYKGSQLASLNRVEVERAGGQIRADINASLRGKPLTGANLRDVLIGCGYSANLADSIVAQYETAGKLTADQIAQAIIKRVLASLSTKESQRTLWKVNHPLTRGFPLDKELNERNILAFVRGDSLDGTSNEGSDEKAFKDFEEKYGKDQLELAFSAAKRIKGTRRDQALEMIAKAYLDPAHFDPEKATEAVDAMTTKSDEIYSKLYEHYVGKPETFGKALEIAKQMSADKRNATLGRFVHHVFQYRSEESHSKLINEALDAIGDENQTIPWGERGPIKVSELRVMIAKDGWKPAVAWRIEQDVLQSVDPQQATAPGESFKLKVPKETALKRLAELDGVIQDKKSSPRQIAYARYVRGKLLFAIASEVGLGEEVKIGDKTVKGKDLYYEAMFELRAAWDKAEESKKEDSSTAVDLQREVFAAMVSVVDRAKHTDAKWEKSTPRKVAGELSSFVPEYDGQNILAKAYDSRKGPQAKNPKKYRDSMSVNKGFQAKYKSVLTGETAPAAPAKPATGTAAAPKAKSAASKPAAPTPAAGTHATAGNPNLTLTPGSLAQLPTVPLAAPAAAPVKPEQQIAQADF